MNEQFCQAILAAAITEGRASELLEALFDGGSVTIDATTRQLVILPGSAITALAGSVGLLPRPQPEKEMT